MSNVNRNSEVDTAHQAKELEWGARTHNQDSFNQALYAGAYAGRDPVNETAAANSVVKHVVSDGKISQVLDMERDKIYDATHILPRSLSTFGLTHKDIEEYKQTQHSALENKLINSISNDLEDLTNLYAPNKQGHRLYDDVKDSEGGLSNQKVRAKLASESTSEHDKNTLQHLLDSRSVIPFRNWHPTTAIPQSELDRMARDNSQDIYDLHNQPRGSKEREPRRSESEQGDRDNESVRQHRKGRKHEHKNERKLHKVRSHGSNRNLFNDDDI